jgi:N(2)-fixation sustaining protein CowN
MDTNAQTGAACGCGKKTDRYVTFKDVDCDGNARRIMAFIEKNIAAGLGNGFWAYFMKKRQPPSGPVPDDLFLVHSHINQIREFFEDSGDEAALALLTQVEEECC